MRVLGIDPRAFSAEKLTPPNPLPYVSRKALARVKDRIEPPSDCPHCGGQVAIVSNATIYGREFGAWPYMYLCKTSHCGARVGLHPDTDLPLGTLATGEMREARKSAKGVFAQAASARFGSDRHASYRWLAQITGIAKEACHFGMFSVEQCRQVERAISTIQTTKETP